MNKLFDREYEEWAVVQEAARLASKIGLEKVLKDVTYAYYELEELANPRSFGPDRDD